MSDVCSFCGERYYEADVLVTTESDFDAIKNGTREAEARIAVPVEDFSRLVGSSRDSRALLN